MSRNLLVLSIGIFVVSCAHHRDVRPGVEGVHKVIVQSEDTESGAQNAISQANHFCEKREKAAAFVKEDKKYTGDMDEQTYKNAKRVAKVAKKVGGAVWVFGGKREKDLGGLVGLGGQAGDSALGKGYTVEMRFKCI